MDASSVTALGDYTLIDAGPDHIFGNKNDKTIRIATATYDPAKDSVTLTLKKPDSLKDSLRLTLNAQPPSGLQDAGGRFLNESASRATGPNAVLAFGAPAKAPKTKKPPKGKPRVVELVRQERAPRFPTDSSETMRKGAGAASTAEKVDARSLDLLLDHAGKTDNSLWR